MSSASLKDLFGEEADKQLHEQSEATPAVDNPDEKKAEEAVDEDPGIQSRKSARRIVDDDEEDEDDDNEKLPEEKLSSPISKVNHELSDDDLFGGDNEDDFDDEENQESARQDKGKQTQLNGYQGDDVKDATQEEAMEHDHPEQEYLEEEIEETEVVAELDIPDLPMPNGNGSLLYYAKLPNFLTVNATAFDPDKYDLEELHLTPKQQQDLEYQEKHERIRLQVENTLRWRYKVNPETGEKEKQSNARFIRWSNGSITLQLGDEMFSVSQKPLTFQPSTTSNKPVQSSQILDVNTAPTTFLVAQPQNTAILQSQGHIHAAVTFLPTSTSSLTHKRLTAAIAGRHTRINRTKMVRTDVDPERIKVEAEAAEADKIRREKREEAKRRKSRGYDDDETPVGSGGARTRSRRDQMLEADEDMTSARSARRKAQEKYIDDEEDGFVVDDEDEDMENSEGEREKEDEEVEPMDDDDEGDPDLSLGYVKKKTSTGTTTDLEPADVDANGVDLSLKRKSEGPDTLPSKKTRRRAVISDDEEE